MNPTILIVSAISSELKFLKIETNNKSILTIPVGIGPIDAAFHTEKLIQTHQPKQIYFIGTAGAYPNSYLSIGDVVLGNHYIFADGSISQLSSYQPSVMVTEVDGGAQCLTKFERFHVKNGAVLNPPGITQSNELANHLKAFFKVSAENLEVFGVARVCQSHHIPFQSVLGISNQVGDLAHEEWKQFQDIAIKNASTVLETLLP